MPRRVPSRVRAEKRPVAQATWLSVTGLWGPRTGGSWIPSRPRGEEGDVWGPGDARRCLQRLGGAETARRRQDRQNEVNAASAACKTRLYVADIEPGLPEGERSAAVRIERLTGRTPGPLPCETPNRTSRRSFTATLFLHPTHLLHNGPHPADLEL